MKTLYLDCGMGAAGDMLTAALLELLPEPDAFVERLNSLHIPEVEFVRGQTQKCGILGTRMSVRVHGAEEGVEDVHGGHGHHDHDHHEDHGSHHHNHSSMRDIGQIVSGLDIPEKVKRDILAVYALIAEAESHVHGVPVEEIHFHEVGTMDAVADITAVCLLMNELAPGAVVVSPIHVGCGSLRCAHGILPVPAPAVTFILKDVPVYGGDIQGELCTPTGAALLKHFATDFGNMPAMKLGAVGYGMGKKDFPRVNCVRAMLGETADEEDVIYELDCNVDDMTGEAMGFAMERLFAAGALEVYTLPVNMKKSRPGMLLRVMCREADREKMAREIFAHTTTIGIREKKCRRYVLDRTISEVRTPWGDVRCKVSEGYGVKRSKYEYEDLAKIAVERGVGLEEVRQFMK